MAKDVIIKLLEDKNKTTGHIAKKLGVSYEAVYKAMNGGCSRKIRLEIAQQLELMPSFLWTGEMPPDKLLLDDFHYMNLSK